ncbi:PREDICTED: ADAMTS-like protein 3 [Condylura cristata]|uniref:ADAMTS-like protein 3 n=1 Tax=Condylura cristata TaxID=143302 RepID=UPI0006436D6B|nr:PREDICTED: ADAMTS-like protein 3 [Condylura cristata]
MERKIDVTNKAVAEILSKTTEYLQPNPAHRAKLGMLNTVSRIRGQATATGYPQTEGLLGDCLLKYGRELGADSSFGECPAAPPGGPSLIPVSGEPGRARPCLWGHRALGHALGLPSSGPRPSARPGGSRVPSGAARANRGPRSVASAGLTVPQPGAAAAAGAPAPSPTQGHTQLPAEGLGVAGAEAGRRAQRGGSSVARELAAALPRLPAAPEDLTMAARKGPRRLPAWLGFALAALLQVGEGRASSALTAGDARSAEEEDGGWDAWGRWSDCSRTCGGGASYSLRRCLSGRDCEGRNIRYRTCSNQDCPPTAEDFRAQQCSAYNDVQYQGRYYEWLPRNDDPARPCALRCHARGRSLVVELAPKVLDGTRCRPDSLDMCISGVCQAVGCDRRLGSQAKEDQCGVCAGSGATCRLVRGQAKAQVSAENREETVIAVPLGSRSARITVKGPAQLFFESKTLQGSRGEHSFHSPGVFVVENTTVEFQRGPQRQVFRIPGPLAADFLFKPSVQTRFTEAGDSVVQFFFYQPISHQWRQTDFFPCTATCGGGEQGFGTRRPRRRPGAWGGGVCTVTCGRGLRYRVVLCVSHRGEHVAGCSPQLRLHSKEECVVPAPCPRPRGEWGPARPARLLTDGSSRSLPDALCPGPRASSRKSCARTECPPHLSPGDWSQGVDSMDTAPLDPLVGNVSRLLAAGAVSDDDLASQLVHQLVASLPHAPPARPPPPGGQGEEPPAAQLRGAPALGPPIPRGRDSGRPRGPMLRRARQRPSVAFNRTVHSRTKAAAYITGATRVISLLCELATPGEATYGWTKDGVALQASGSTSVSSRRAAERPGGGCSARGGHVSEVGPGRTGPSAGLGSEDSASVPGQPGRLGLLSARQYPQHPAAPLAWRTLSVGPQGGRLLTVPRPLPGSPPHSAEPLGHSYPKRSPGGSSKRSPDTEEHLAALRPDVTSKTEASCELQAGGVHLVVASEADRCSPAW